MPHTSYTALDETLEAAGRPGADSTVEGFEQQAHIERGRGVGQRPDADEIDPRLGDRPHVVERDAARCLELGAAVHELDGPAQLVRGHVVQEEPRYARLK